MTESSLFVRYVVNTNNTAASAHRMGWHAAFRSLSDVMVLTSDTFLALTVGSDTRLPLTGVKQVENLSSLLTAMPYNYFHLVQDPLSTSLNSWLRRQQHKRSLLPALESGLSCFTLLLIKDENTLIIGGWMFLESHRECREHKDLAFNTDCCCINLLILMFRPDCAGWDVAHWTVHSDYYILQSLFHSDE